MSNNNGSIFSGILGSKNGFYWIASNNKRYRVSHALARSIETENILAHEYIGSEMKFTIRENFFQTKDSKNFDGLVHEIVSIESNNGQNIQ
jgi:hypothetical protein